MRLFHRFVPFLPAIALSYGLSGTVSAAENENGVLILHGRTSVAYSSSEGSECGLSGLTKCEDATTRVDGSGPFICHIFAAFPATGSPCLGGLTFGVQYDEAALQIVDYGNCGDWELATDDWPSSGSGLAVTWEAPQDAHLTEVYWLLVEADDSMPSELMLMEHPTQGGNFGETCTLYYSLDDIVAFGSMGFNRDGALPCPDGPVPTVQASWGNVKKSYR